ncbi:MAG: hypothetical protein HYT72_04790 [Candidatus Aenigmarchaeota archaeon]|nr:hypothetical protein [Candidatus Aenigmarchaeota archaeon]
MKEFIFEYILFPLVETESNQLIRKKRPIALLPFVLPEMTIEDNTTRIAALIDSGADKSVSFKEIGEGLGLKFFGQATEPISGISGETKAWKLPIKVKIGDEEFVIEINWMDKEMDANSDYPFVLGREGIFDKFDIEFKSNSKIIFRKA